MSDTSTPPTSPRATVDFENPAQSDALRLVIALLEIIEDLAAPDLAPTGVLEVVDKAFRDGPSSRELSGHIIACLDSHRLCARLSNRQDLMQGVAEEAFEAGLSVPAAGATNDHDVGNESYETDASEVDRLAGLAAPSSSVPPKTVAKQMMIQSSPAKPKSNCKRQAHEMPESGTATVPVSPSNNNDQNKKMGSSAEEGTDEEPVTASPAHKKAKSFSPLELIVAAAPALAPYVHAHKVKGAIACVEAVSDYKDLVSKYRFLGVVDGRIYGIWRENWSPTLKHNQVYLDRSGTMRLTATRRGFTGERDNALTELEKAMPSCLSKADIYAIIFALGFSPKGRGPTLLLSKRFDTMNPSVMLFPDRNRAERAYTHSVDFLITVSCSEKTTEAWLERRELTAA